MKSVCALVALSWLLLFRFASQIPIAVPHPRIAPAHHPRICMNLHVHVSCAFIRANQKNTGIAFGRQSRATK
jgi:hypothetical protein